MTMEIFLQSYTNFQMCFPTKHLLILVPAPLFLYLVPYFHQFSAVEYLKAEKKWDKFL